MGSTWPLGGGFLQADTEPWAREHVDVGRRLALGGVEHRLIGIVPRLREAARQRTQPAVTVRRKVRRDGPAANAEADAPVRLERGDGLGPQHERESR